MGGRGSKLRRNKCQEFIDAAELSGSSWKRNKIELNNFMELLLYVDATNCAFLKEEVMNFIAENRAKVLEKVKLHYIPVGLFANLLAATSRKLPREGGEEEFSSMRVSELRRKLRDK